MADLTPKTIAELPEDTSISGSEVFPVMDGSTSKKIPLSKLVKSDGDTMTGILTLDKTYIQRNLPALSSGTSYYMLRAKDAEGVYRGGVSVFRSATYGDGIVLSHWKTINGTSRDNQLYLFVDDSGNRIVSVSESAPWRKALGISFGVGQAHSIGYRIQLAGIITNSAKKIFLSYVPSRDIEDDVTAINVTQFKGTIVGVNGALDTSNSNTDWLTKADVTITASKIHRRLIRILISTDTAFSNGVTDTPIITYCTLGFSFS